METKKTILITGSSGIIGRKLCGFLSSSYKVIGFDKVCQNGTRIKSYTEVEGDITDTKQLERLCDENKPDVIIHCAGIAHQSVNSTLTAENYFAINYKATMDLAKIACEKKSKVHFIFLSSISIYGEFQDGAKIDENHCCHPTTPYARSKLKAEIGLKRMWEKNQDNKLDILRLAPVYSRQWCLNLEKRVFGPLKICYVRFGSGNQKMSALSLYNLVSFIQYRIERLKGVAFINTFNITDRRDYSFNEIIEIFKKSRYQPIRITITIPMGIIRLVTMILAKLFPTKKDWILSCYDKLAFSLIFNNNEMLGTGFIPKHSLDSTLLKK